jgi:hypothetical protein
MPIDKTLSMIQLHEENIGQFSSKTRAVNYCKNQLLPHKYILTSCYRPDDNGVPVQRLCWAIYLSLGKTRDLHRALYGSY